MRRRIVIMAVPLVLAACQGANSVPPPSGAQGPSLTSAERATFSHPSVPDGKGPPFVPWIFVSNGQHGNVDVYNARTLKMISQCSCSGVGLAVDPLSGDLAVGTRSGTVTVWHVQNAQITLFSTLNLSQGPYAVGLAFDKKGDLYAANAGDNGIDFFAANKIQAGGGNPTRTLLTSHLTEAVYLAADGRSLLADGYNVNGQPIVVSVNTSSGADTIVQNVQSGTVPEGIVLDRHQNLILNDVGYSDTLAVFAKPWTGSPKSKLAYGSAQNGYYTGISLNKAQTVLWAANFTLPTYRYGVGSVQANSYPLGTVGRSSAGILSEYYDSIAVDPQ